MRRSTTRFALLSSCLAVGCADDRGSTGSGVEDGTGAEGVDSGSGGTAEGSGSGEGGDGDGDVGPKLDVGAGDGDGDGDGDCLSKCGNTDWSYVWVANSGENTISKINTRDLVEEGRYQTRPDASGNPSRTSVSIDGKAVVVANRMGGVTKIFSRESLCDDKNDNGQIETSSGPGNVLAFADEECIAWHTEFPGATTQRPVAWTPGDYNEVTCEYDNQQVWTAAAFGMGGTWPCDGTDGIHVYLLDGETGDINEDIHMPDVSCGSTLGPYGAAVDDKGNVWIYIWSAGTIVHVELETLDYFTFAGGSYGITVDTEGRVWTGDYPQRYDPDMPGWQSPNPNLPGSGGAGIAQDLQGRMWTSTTGGAGWVDMETLVMGDTVPLPSGNTIYRGISVDIDGFIWAIPLGGNIAYRIDPDTYDVQSVGGLNSPYTYSDMSGGQLKNVTCNPPEG